MMKIIILLLPGDTSAFNNADDTGEILVFWASINWQIAFPSHFLLMAQIISEYDNQLWARF